MSTSHKEKIIRVLQLFQTTDEKTPMNAVQISQKLEHDSLRRDFQKADFPGD